MLCSKSSPNFWKWSTFFFKLYIQHIGILQHSYLCITIHLFRLSVSGRTLALQVKHFRIQSQGTIGLMTMKSSSTESWETESTSKKSEKGIASEDLWETHTWWQERRLDLVNHINSDSEDLWTKYWISMILVWVADKIWCKRTSLSRVGALMGFAVMVTFSETLKCFGHT